MFTKISVSVSAFWRNILPGLFLYSITQLLLSCHHWLGSTWDTGTFPSFSHALHFYCILKYLYQQKRCCVQAGGSRLTAPRAALLHHLSRTPIFPSRTSEKNYVFSPVPPKEGVMSTCVWECWTLHMPFRVALCIQGPHLPINPTHSQL